LIQFIGNPPNKRKNVKSVWIMHNSLYIFVEF